MGIKLRLRYTMEVLMIFNAV